MERFDFIAKWGNIRNRFRLVGDPNHRLTAENAFLMAAKLHAIKIALTTTDTKGTEPGLLGALLSLPPFSYTIEDATYPRRYVLDYLNELTNNHFDDDNVFVALNHMIDSAEKAYQTLIEFQPADDDELDGTDWSFRPINQTVQDAVKSRAQLYFVAAAITLTAVGAFLLYAHFQHDQVLKSFAAIAGIVGILGLVVATRGLERYENGLHHELERNVNIGEKKRHTNCVLSFGTKLDTIDSKSIETYGQFLKEEVGDRFTAPARLSR